MSNILWYPETIKACVFTDVLNWKTSEKSYEDLCKRFGNDAFMITSHQKLFNEFIREMHELTRAQTNINEIMFNESIYIRYRILQDVISKVPINTSYKESCKMLGNVNYPEFESWYYRFYNGQRDLYHDRSNDPKPLTFSDLPTDVVEKILEISELKPRFILRRVSRSLRSLVDSCKLSIGNITFYGDTDLISTNVDGIKKLYSARFRSRIGRIGPIAPITYLDNAPCRHLSTFIRNPKLQLGSLDIKFFPSFKDNKLVVELFKSETHQLHLKSLKIKVPSEQILTDFVRCFKPRVLRKIEIGWDYMKSIHIHGIIESEQWKQAEEVIITNSVDCNIAHFFHFKCFDISLKEYSTGSILELRDGISKSSNFEWCRIRMQFELRFIRVLIGEEFQKSLGLKKHVHNNMEYFVYNIPNSTEMLVFSFLDREIFIKKSNLSSGF